MAKQRYRELVAPTLVDVAARSTPSGAEQAAQRLSQTFESFSRLGSDIGARLNAQIGERAGSEEGQAGEPNFRRGLRSLTAYGAAYNNAALRGYAIRTETDMEQTAARLEAEANNDPDAFRAAMEKVRDGVVKEAPAEAKAVVGQIYDQRTAAGLGRIQTALSAELRAEDRTLVNEQLDRTIERVAFLRAQDTPEAYAASVQEEFKMRILIDGAVSDGTMTETEGLAARRTLARRVIFETVSARFDNEINDPYGDPIGFIEDLKEANETSDTLTTEEEQQLENTLLAELRERNLLQAARDAQMRSEVEARHAAGDQEYTSRMLAGQLTRRDLLEATRNDEITPAIARTLLNELQSSATQTPKSNAETLFHYETNLLSYTEEEIATERGLTWADRSKLIQERRKEETGWKGTQVAKEAFDRIDRALGIPPGTMLQLLPEEEKRQRDQAFTELYDIIDALPPEERQAAILDSAQTVIRRVVGTNAARDLANYRAQREEYIQGAGPVEDMNARERETYERTLSRLDNLIREAENRRQQ